MSEESTDTRLARIEEQMKSHNDIWLLHTKQDMKQFSELRNLVSGLDDKVDKLIVNEAKRAGEASVLKRISGYISAVVAAIILAAVEFIKYVF